MGRIALVDKKEKQNGLGGFDGEGQVQFKVVTEFASGITALVVVCVALEFDRGLGLSCYLEVYMRLSWCRKRELEICKAHPSFERL